MEPSSSVEVWVTVTVLLAPARIPGVDMVKDRVVFGLSWRTTGRGGAERGEREGGCSVSQWHGITSRPVLISGDHARTSTASCTHVRVRVRAHAHARRQRIEEWGGGVWEGEEEEDRKMSLVL